MPRCATRCLPMTACYLQQLPFPQSLSAPRTVWLIFYQFLSLLLFPATSEMSRKPQQLNLKKTPTQQESGGAGSSSDFKCPQGFPYRNTRVGQRPDQPQPGVSSTASQVATPSQTLPGLFDMDAMIRDADISLVYFKFHLHSWAFSH